MIQKLVAFALRMPIVVLVCTVVVIGAGLFAYSELDIEAYPNPVPPLVEIITQPDGWSAEEVERYVTVPLEIGLAGMPGLDHVRSQSLFGLTDVKCYFKWGTTYGSARQEVINRLQFVQLPEGVQPELSPWNAIGEVFRYELDGQGLRAARAEDGAGLDPRAAVQAGARRHRRRELRRRDEAVPGRASIPIRLRGHGVTLDAADGARSQARTRTSAGSASSSASRRYNVRGIGLAQERPRHRGRRHRRARRACPIRVRTSRRSTSAHAPRLGIVGHDDERDIVQGIVLMRYGGETPTTLKGIHETHRVHPSRTTSCRPAWRSSRTTTAATS